MNVWERGSEIKGIFYSHCKNIITKVPDLIIDESHKLRYSGEIRIEEIKFTDDSILNFLEYLNLGNIERYSYEYIRPTGFFFLYENEGYKNGVRKPLHHLHVGVMKGHNEGLIRLLPEELIEHDGPHLMAPEIKFNKFMGIIVVNFFDDEENCEEMLHNLECNE